MSVIGTPLDPGFFATDDAMALTGHRSVQTAMTKSSGTISSDRQVDPEEARRRDGPSNYYHAGEVGKARAARLLDDPEDSTKLEN